MDYLDSALLGADTSPLTNATAESRRRADEMYRYLATLQQQFQQQQAAQGATTRALDRTIQGTGPSVAGTQLQQGVGQTRNAISAQASGANGVNAGVANYGAIQAIGAAQAKQQQDAALLRAQEVEQAIKAKAGILGQEQAATVGMAGQTTGAGTALQGQDVAGSGNVVQANEQEVAARRAFIANLINSAGTGAMAMGTGKGAA